MLSKYKWLLSGLCLTVSLSLIWANTADEALVKSWLQAFQLDSASAYLTSIAIFTLGSYMFAPLSLMVFATSFMFSHEAGLFVGVVGAQVQCFINHWIGSTIQKKEKPNFDNSKLLIGLKNNSFIGIVLARFLPVVPSSAVGISAGYLKIPRKTYMLASGIATFPAIYVIVFFQKKLFNYIGEF